MCSAINRRCGCWWLDLMVMLTMRASFMLALIILVLAFICVPCSGKSLFSLPLFAPPLVHAPMHMLGRHHVPMKLWLPVGSIAATPILLPDTLQYLNTTTGVASPSKAGYVGLTTVYGNVVIFNITGDFYATDPYSSSIITNINTAVTFESVIIRYGPVLTLPLGFADQGATNNALDQQSICSSVTSISGLSVTQISCSLPFGTLRYLSFSLWQVDISGYPQLVSSDTSLVDSGNSYDSFGYPTPTITDGSIRRASSLTDKSRTLLANALNLPETIAFEGTSNAFACFNPFRLCDVNIITRREIGTNFDASTINVTYASSGQSIASAYSCVVDTNLTTSTLLVCTTVGLRDGSTMYFTVRQGDPFALPLA
jgi:hypothetical protein